MSSTAVHQGGCLCGAVRYSAIGNPVLLTICYCRFCQRATGSSHLIEPVWRDHDFSLSRGNPQTFEAISSGSGKRVTLHFCGVCGTKVYSTMERFSGVVGVYGGTLDDPGIAFAAKETWRIFLDDAAPETIIPPGVNVWHKHRLDNDGQPLEPAVFEEMHVIAPIA